MKREDHPLTAELVHEAVLPSSGEIYRFVPKFDVLVDKGRWVYRRPFWKAAWSAWCIRDQYNTLPIERSAQRICRYQVEGLNV